MNENTLKFQYDVVVVGAGHAGCEAALAAARLGMETIIFTVSMDSVAMMPCNPNIGGTSKGHLVREIDALGGQMGINIDKTFLQSRMLNASKGPAVHSLRAQADKAMYSLAMRKTLQETEHLTLRQAEVTALLTEEESKTPAEGDSTESPKKQRIIGVQTTSGAVYYARAVILCTGTYLRARCLYGDVIEYTGPNGLKAANSLTASLEETGIQTVRFKTGTPARIDRRTIDFSKMTEQKGDERIVPFSFTTDPDSIQKEQVSCYLTYTNEETHRILRDNLHRSPLYAGVIEGTGPRYCPSIEDKVVRFADKDRHQLFVEPEGAYTNEMYISGASSSMPEDVQEAFYHTIAGLENAKIVRNAYAIEYDCIPASQLKPSLEFKNIHGLFAAGQFNGSSGYEEAAAQGLMAGINAARLLTEKEPVVLTRSQAYIGVLIDDLVTKESHEPYRMMTARAEYRLLLRQDNADLRLTPIGHEIGLISDERYRHVCEKQEQIESELARLKTVYVGPNPEVLSLLEEHESTPIGGGTSLVELIRRPELSYEATSVIDPERPAVSMEVAEQINIQIKYEGYIQRQEKQVAEFMRIEKKKLWPDLPYESIAGLRLEARQKLAAMKPENIGQASRISGVSPADISVLLVWLESHAGEKENQA